MPAAIARLNRWQSALVLFLNGALMTLGFAPYHYWPVIFISLPLFYLFLKSAQSRAQSLWRGFYFGYGHAMAGTWWIANALLVDADKFAWMLPFSVLGLSAVMALWFVAFAYLIHRFRAHLTPILFAVLWVVVEYLRSFGMFGFPWNLAGYIALSSIEIAQLAATIGTYGLSLLVVLFGLTPLIWLGEKTRRAKILQTLAVLMIWAGCYSYGFHEIPMRKSFTNTTIRVVQPNIPQSLKGSREGSVLAVKVLGELTNKPTGIVPDVTIWPETAYPFTVRKGEPLAVPHIKMLLTGAVRAEGIKPNLKIWNSLIAIMPAGDVVASYDKHQLVPFGEFVPLRSVLPLDKITPGDLDFSRGEGPQTVTLPGIPPFSPLVCYEGIFPSMAVAKERPAWLLNVTNDGWYGDTAGPYQHFDMVRMRAIEQRLPVVRAANSGISAVIDPYGRVVASLPLNQRAFLDLKLPAMVVGSAYANHGELITVFLLMLLFLYTIMRRDISKNK